MDDAGFLKLIKRSSNIMLFVGIGILAFGVFIIWLIASGADSEADELGSGGKIALYIFGGILLVLGVFMVLLPMRTNAKVRSGQHPLVNALQNNDENFALWIYEHVTQTRAGGTRAGSNHQIWIMGRNKKQYAVNTPKSKIPDAMSYLMKKFPNAMFGYTQEFESRYHQQLKEI